MSSAGTPLAGPPIAGIVVTFFPDTGFEQRLAAIARETAPLIVVDNSTEEGSRVTLRKLCAIHRARLIENSENRGLGAALNQAFATLGPDAEWAITFDQDSTPEMGLAAALERTAAESRDKPAAVGANWRDEARPNFAARHLRRRAGFPLLFERVEARENLHAVTCVITSGTLYHVPTVRQLGGFDAALFLDLVDTEFCLRARAAGRDVRVAAAAHLQHRRGNKQGVKFCGVTFWPAFQPPSRLHVLFQNRIRLFRCYAGKFPHWVLFELIYASKIFAEIIFLEDQKTTKLLACLRGTWRGMTAREPLSSLAVPTPTPPHR